MNFAQSSTRSLHVEQKTPREVSAPEAKEAGSSQKRAANSSKKEFAQADLPLLNKKHIQSPEFVRAEQQQLVSIKEFGFTDIDPKSASMHGSACSILSLNIFMRPPLIKNNKSDHKEDRLKDAFSFLSNFEIVCLQEMFDTLSTRKLRMKLQAFDHGFQSFAESPPPSLFATGQIIDGGLLTLSKYPIVENSFFGFSAGCEIDKIAQKGVLYTKIRVVDGPKPRYLHLFNTHLQSSYDKYYSDKTKLSFLQHIAVVCRLSVNNTCGFLVRFAQVIELREFVVRCQKKHNFDPKSDLMVLCGDLNIDYYGQALDLSVYRKAFPAELAFLDQLPASEKLNEHQLAVKLLGSGKDGFRVKDLLDTANSHPHPKYTYADAQPNAQGKFVPCETVLTCKEDLLQSMRLDYMLQLEPQNMTAALGGEQPSVSNVRCQVEKLQVKEREYTHLSDHYGISLAFTLD